jgi:hypothetical protein
LLRQPEKPFFLNTNPAQAKLMDMWIKEAKAAMAQVPTRKWKKSAGSVFFLFIGSHDNVARRICSQF